MEFFDRRAYDIFISFFLGVALMAAVFIFFLLTAQPACAAEQVPQFVLAFEDDDEYRRFQKHFHEGQVEGTVGITRMEGGFCEISVDENKTWSFSCVIPMADQLGEVRLTRIFVMNGIDWGVQKIFFNVDEEKL